jgi:hypothetical protein
MTFMAKDSVRSTSVDKGVSVPRGAKNAMICPLDGYGGAHSATTNDAYVPKILNPDCRPGAELAPRRSPAPALSAVACAFSGFRPSIKRKKTSIEIDEI